MAKRLIQHEDVESITFEINYLKEMYLVYVHIRFKEDGKQVTLRSSFGMDEIVIHEYNIDEIGHLMIAKENLYHGGVEV